MRGLVIVLLAAGCSFPEKTLSQEGAPFACYQQPLPTTAPAKVVISGGISDPFNGTPVAGAVLEGFLVGTAASIFSVTSDATGAFSHDQGTGGAPRQTYFRTAPNGFVPTYYYPAAPLASDIDVRISLFNAMGLAVIGQVAEVNIDPGKVTFLIGVLDCNGDPIAGATVTTNPPGDTRYFANTTPSPTAVATDAMTGSAMIANVPPGNTTISATVNGMTLHSYSLDGVAGAIMEPQIQP